MAITRNKYPEISLNGTAKKVIHTLHRPTLIQRILVFLDEGVTKGFGMGEFKGLRTPKFKAVNVAVYEILYTFFG
jgi:hypothetical protein